MGVHPDRTAYRAVDACGGAHTKEQYLSGFAEGHSAALHEAMVAVKEADELTYELLAALQLLLNMRDQVEAREYARAIVKKATNPLARYQGN